MPESRTASPFPSVKRANSLNESENIGKLRRISYITHKSPSPPPQRKPVSEGRLRRISYITSNEFSSSSSTSNEQHPSPEKGLRRLSLAPFSLDGQLHSVEGNDLRRIRRTSHISHKSYSPPRFSQQLSPELDLGQRRPSLPGLNSSLSPPYSSPLSFSAFTPPASNHPEPDMGSSSSNPSLAESTKHHNRRKTYGGDLAAATRQILLDYEERIAHLEAQNTRISVELEANRYERDNERHSAAATIEQQQIPQLTPTALDTHRDEQSDLLYERKLRLEIVESAKKLRAQNNSLSRSLAESKEKYTSLNNVLESEREERRAMEDEIKRLAQANFTLLEHNKLLVARDTALQEDISTLITKSQADEWMRSVLEAELRKTRQQAGSMQDVPPSPSAISERQENGGNRTPRTPTGSQPTLGMTFEHQGHLRLQVMAARDELHVTKRCLEESEKRCNDLAQRIAVLQRNMSQCVDSSSHALAVERELRGEVGNQVTELIKVKALLEEQVQSLTREVEALRNNDSAQETSKGVAPPNELNLASVKPEKTSRRKSALMISSKRDSRVWKISDRQFKRLSKQRNKYILASKSSESPAITTALKHSDILLSKVEDVPETPESSSSTLVYSPPPFTSPSGWTPVHSATNSLIVPLSAASDSISTTTSSSSKSKNPSARLLVSNYSKMAKLSPTTTTLKTDVSVSVNAQKVARYDADLGAIQNQLASMTPKERKRASAILTYIAQTWLSDRTESV